MLYLDYGKQLIEEQIIVLEDDQGGVENHTHNFLEFTYVKQGAALHYFGENAQIVNAGDFYLVDYNVEHKYHRISNEKFVVINCIFLPTFIDKTLYNCRKLSQIAENYLINVNYNSLKSDPSKCIYHDDDGRISVLVNQMLDEYRRKNTGFQEIMRCNLIELIILTMRNQLNTRIIKDSVIKQIMEYTDNHYMEELTLKQLAKNTYFSLSYISKKFKEEIGVSYCEYLQSVRIAESRRLLINTDLKTYEICNLVGYTDIKYFNRLFKKFMGVSPHQFRIMRTQ